MSSRIENNLQQVINQYFEEDSKKKALEKELKSKNAFIKSTLAEMGKDLYETDKCKATISCQNRVSMDEEKVIEIIKENISAARRKGVIKTIEYVDYEVLESLIYNGVIAAEKLEPAQSVNVITTLKVTALKKKEEEKGRRK